MTDIKTHNIYEALTSVETKIVSGQTAPKLAAQRPIKTLTKHPVKIFIKPPAEHPAKTPAIKILTPQIITNIRKTQKAIPDTMDPLAFPNIGRPSTGRKLNNLANSSWEKRPTILFESAPARTVPMVANKDTQIMLNQEIQKTLREQQCASDRLTALLLAVDEASESRRVGTTPLPINEAPHLASSDECSIM